MSASYVSSHYGIDSEDVIICKNNKVVNGSKYDYKEYEKIVEFANNNDLSQEINYSQVCDKIDIGSYIDYMCFEIYVANCDSIANNVAIWKSRKVDPGNPYADGKWRWLLYDTDDSAGMVTGRTEPNVDSFIEGQWTTSPMEDKLFSALLYNDQFRKQFGATFIEMSDNSFAFSRVNNDLNNISQHYKKQVVLSQRRFRGPQMIKDYHEDYDGTYDEQDFDREVNVIRSFYRNRKRYIVNDMFQHILNFE